MKKVIAIATLFAAASAATSLFAAAAYAGSQDETASHSASHAATQAVYANSQAMGLSQGVGGTSVSASGHSVSVSRSMSDSTSSTHGSQPRIESVQQGATKTRCITKKSGDVEEKVCEFTTIPLAEANTYFAEAQARGSAHTAQ